jgi:hypothetical protein
MAYPFHCTIDERRMLEEKTQGIGTALFAIPAIIILTIGFLYTLIRLVSFLETFLAPLR